MDKFNEIQQKWIKYAEMLTDNLSLRDLIVNDKDDFISLVLDSKKAKLSQYFFNIQDFNDPEKDLHDKLFRLASDLDSLNSDKDITQRLIEDLNNSLLGSFSL